MTSQQIEAAQSLQAVDVPPDVYQVRGCSCGGGCGIHRVDCTIFRLRPDQIRRAEEEAEQRCTEFGAALTAAFYAGIGR